MSVYYLRKGEFSSGFTLAYGDTLCIDGGQAVNAQAYGIIQVQNGGEARDIILDGYYDSGLGSCVGGQMEVRQGGTASGITVLGLTSDDEYYSLSYRIFTGTLTVCGGTVYDTKVSVYGKLVVTSGTAEGVRLAANATCIVGSGGVLGGEISLPMGCRLQMDEGSILDFTLSGRSPEDQALLNAFSRVPDTPEITITVLRNQAFGRYSLAENASGFDRTALLKCNDGVLAELTLAKGGSSESTQRIYSLQLEDSTLVLEISPLNGEFSCVANADGLSYTITIGSGTEDGLLLQGGGGVLQADVLDSVTLWNLGGEECTLLLEGGSAEETIANDASGKVVARASGNTRTDLFLANVTGRWKGNYQAMHCGTLSDGWEGTGEKVDLKGKNVIGSIFEGADADASTALLCLTDDAQGDALFVDDVYTELPEGVEGHQARIARISEIRAGFGDDVVDMTSQMFAYVGKGVTIRGGLGDDVLWSSTGENRLFGDAGNDRLVGAGGRDILVGGIGNDSMHGGGGDDLFCFCENWGMDIVEQLPGGKATLWFASENDGNWNAETLTYTCGGNSVCVTGVTASDVLLKFGDDGSEQYAELLAAGAFADFTSEKIFEDMGMLA